jgi:hypothetical protein
MSAFLIDRANVKRTAVLGALGAVLLLSAVPARAQAQEEDNGYDIQILRKAMGAIGLRDDKPDINYRERSPLVIPPSTALPPPVSSAVSNPNWPVDPEVKYARQQSAAKNRPGATGDMIYDDGRVLSPDELKRGRAKRDVTATPNQIGSQASPKELGAPTVFNFFKKAFARDEEVAKFTGEPERTSLVEPPTGYQTPAPTAAYGIGQKNQTPQATKYYGTHGTLEERR